MKDPLQGLRKPLMAGEGSSSSGGKKQSRLHRAMSLPSLPTYSIPCTIQTTTPTSSLAVLFRNLMTRTNETADPSSLIPKEMKTLTSIAGVQLAYCAILGTVLQLSHTDDHTPFQKHPLLFMGFVGSLLYAVLMYTAVLIRHQRGSKRVACLGISIYLAATLACLIVTTILFLP